MEMPGQDRETMRRAPLAPGHVGAIRAIGNERLHPMGATVTPNGVRPAEVMNEIRFASGPSARRCGCAR